MWAAQYLALKNPRSWLTSGSMGTMGFGLPAAIGAQFACPDKTVINIDGDGSIRMNLGELETVTTYNLPVKILVLNNSGDGMVRQWQRLFFAERFCGSASLQRRFAKAAGPMVWFAVAFEADIPAVLRRFGVSVSFLEVVIDEHCVYPWSGAVLATKVVMAFHSARTVAVQDTGKRTCFKCGTMDDRSIVHLTLRTAAPGFGMNIDEAEWRASWKSAT
jgi:acetolactate synthase-1/2/3 large subunit